MKDFFYGKENYDDTIEEFDVTVSRTKTIRQTALVKIKSVTPSVAMEDAESYCNVNPDRISWKDVKGSESYGDTNAVDVEVVC